MADDETIKVESQKNAKKDFVRPPFDLWRDLKEAMNFLLFDKTCFVILIPLIIIFESLFLKLITRHIPYTEIDYQAYMEQVEMITIDKEMDYSKIRGPTGPLVYPAGHVWIYRLMYHITDGMNNLKEGQVVFRYLYLVTMVLQLIVYLQLELPPWCVIFACISKRLHSIYVLRLFNDCFTTFFSVLTVLLLVIAVKKPLSTTSKKLLALLASLTYSIAVSIKMNALLYLPAIVVSLYVINEANLMATISNGLLIIGWQIFVALPFLKTYPTEYLSCAFNFKREFMFEWSINWQFLEPEGFQNQWFHRTLLLSQFVTILTIILFKYPNLPVRVLQSFSHPFTNFPTLSKAPIPFVLITTNFAGVIFSRSLHYQFLSWYHWTIPCLLYYAHIPWQLAPLWYVAHEWCWNSYPPNSTASILLFALNTTLLLLIAFFNISPSVQSPLEYSKKLN